MATPLTQPVPGEVENALAELYPELVPMPTADGTVNSLGRRMRADLYGGGGGGLGLLGGGRPQKPNMDATPGELAAAAAAGVVSPPNYGVPPILPPGPPVAETWPAAPGPVDLSVIPPSIPPLVPRPGVSAGPLPEAGGLFPPVTRPPNLPLPSYDRGDAGNLISPYTPPPQGSVGAPWNRKVVSSTLAQAPGPRVAPGDRPAAPGDVGPEGRGMAERPTLRGTVDPPSDITDQTAKETADIETATNDAKDFLYDAQGQGIGWIDDGIHGFGQSLMLMYGGGLEPTVTQGPPVQFSDRGTPTTSTDYLNFATGSPIIPSLLPEGQRLGQIAPSGVTTTGVGTGGGKKSIDVTGVTATAATGRGGEGRTPFQTFLENQDNAGRLIPGGLNSDAAALKGTAAINQLRAGEGRITERDFEGVDSFEKFGNLFETKLGLEGVGNGIASFIQEFTGMQEGDLRGPGLWNTLNSPIPMISTGGVNITPLDVITLIAGGLPAIGPILMSKFMDGLFNPITSGISNGVKGLFSTIFGRGGEGGDVSQANINTADLDTLAEELGISKPAGMIDAGTYYGADGGVLATNMKSLDFGLNTANGADSFKDVLNNIAVNIDPNYEATNYNTRTGQVDVLHADGTVTESASYITTDSEGNMSQGVSANKKTSKKVDWSVNVVGVESIETVAPRKSKGKSKSGGKSIWDWIKDRIGGDDDDDDGQPPEESGK